MKTAAKQGLVFNSNKCHISQPQITFYGTIFSAQGIKPDPMKIQALQDLPTPQTQKQLQSFLGLVNYLQPFLPGIASKTTFSPQANITMGLESLNRQLLPEVKTVDLQHTPQNNTRILRQTSTTNSTYRCK